MTPDACDRVLAVLMSAWPERTWPKPTALLWGGELAALEDPNTALNVARHLARTSERPAALATYLAAYHDARRRASVARADTGQLALPTSERYADRATTGTWVARCRQQLANAQGPLADTLRTTVTGTGNQT